MSKLVRFTQCPKCAEQGRDSRKDNLANYSDDSKHCFSCSYHEHAHIFKRFVKDSDEEIRAKEKERIPNDYRDWETDRKSTRLNSSHLKLSRMPSSA